MGVITFLRSGSDRITKMAAYLVLGFLGVLIWHFSTLDILDENWETLNEVVFESPNYPEMHNVSSVSTTTTLKFFVDKQFGGIKVTFYDWDLQDDRANLTDTEEEEFLCDKFSIRLIGTNFRSSVMCGALKGYTILVDRNVNSRGIQTLEIRIQFGENDLKCKWRLKVSQISMSKLHYIVNWGRKSRQRRQSLFWQNEEENEVVEPLETPLIANGLETNLINVPWQVSIRDMARPPVFAELRGCSPSSGRHFCGGSLISSDLVLSASHCFFTSWSELRSLSSLRVIVGCPSTCLTSDHNECVQSHEIQSVYIHYGFNLNTYMNDIVLIKLKNPVVFNERVRPIQLSSTEDVEGKTAYISGWGRTNLTVPESHSGNLLYGKVILESNEYCSQEYPEISEANENLKKSVLCSSLTSSTSSSGKGDSGGGLYSAEEPNLMGVISFILPRSNLSYFQSVVFFENWIKLAVHF